MTATDVGWDEWVAELEGDYAQWLTAVLPRWFPLPLADHHKRFWAHVWTIDAGQRRPPYLAIWARGGAKSSSLEAACVALGARRRRRYGLWVNRTQDQANDHVANVAAMLESPELAAFYPEMAERAVGKYGNSKGWSRTRLRTRQGFTLDAIGLDTAARGVKLEDQRPDLIVVEDLDEEFDTAAFVRKLEGLLTKKILQAGSADLCILGGQNLIHENGIFGRVAFSKADYLRTAVVDGPVPAVHDPEIVRVDGIDTLVGGVPTWVGQDLAACQAKIDEVGLSAWLSEAQHETEPPAGGMFSHLEWEAINVDDPPEMVRTACWCDPAVTDKDQSDANGIAVDGLGVDGRLYALFSWEQRSSPVGTLTVAVQRAVEYGCTYVGVETDQGGDTWESVVREAVAAAVAAYREAGDAVSAKAAAALGFRQTKAGSSQMSKAARAQRWLLPLYEKDKVRHVTGTHAVRQRALRRFPLLKPLDFVDAAVWAARDLMEPADDWGGELADYSPAGIARKSPWRT